MADSFGKQAKQYAKIRPTYPPELFQFIASKTTAHDLVWDAGTGNGQAARSLAEIYNNVIATDMSLKQLEFSPKLPNIRYQHTSPVMSMAELEQKISTEGRVDLVTIAEAVHWFDRPTFYHQVKHVLKKPDGVVAAWCYTKPTIDDGPVDAVFRRFYRVDSDPYWYAGRHLVDNGYETIDFPFEPVKGLENTGPFRFVAEKVMDVDMFLTYIRTWSAYQTAKDKGVELLNENVVEDFKRAWSEDGNDKKIVKYPVYLRIGRVGNLCSD